MKRTHGLAAHGRLATRVAMHTVNPRSVSWHLALQDRKMCSLLGAIRMPVFVFRLQLSIASSIFGTGARVLTLTSELKQISKTTYPFLGPPNLPELITAVVCLCGNKLMTLLMQ